MGRRTRTPAAALALTMAVACGGGATSTESSASTSPSNTSTVKILRHVRTAAGPIRMIPLFNQGEVVQVEPPAVR
jgi:ABC-type glycerol-3-phosphate transport system substrate-binding protein